MVNVTFPTGERLELDECDALDVAIEILCSDRAEAFVMDYAGMYNEVMEREVRMPRQLTELQKSDFEWFKFKMPELYADHGHCYAIVSDKSILGTYQTYGDAVDAALKVSEYGKFIVQEVGPDESAYTATFRIPSVEDADYVTK